MSRDSEFEFEYGYYCTRCCDVVLLLALVEDGYEKCLVWIEGKGFIVVPEKLL